MKYIICDTPKGQFKISLKKIAEHRASYYAKVDQVDIGSYQWQEEVNWVMRDKYEAIDWLLNNTDWDQWEKDAEKLNDNINVTEKHFWTSSDNFKIIDNIL